MLKRTSWASEAKGPRFLSSRWSLLGIDVPSPWRMGKPKMVYMESFATSIDVLEAVFIQRISRIPANLVARMPEAGGRVYGSRRDVVDPGRLCECLPAGRRKADSGLFVATSPPPRTVPALRRPRPEHRELALRRSRLPDIPVWRCVEPAGHSAPVRRSGWLDSRLAQVPLAARRDTGGSPWRTPRSPPHDDRFPPRHKPNCSGTTADRDSLQRRARSIAAPHPSGQAAPGRRPCCSRRRRNSAVTAKRDRSNRGLRHTSAAAAECGPCD